MQINRSILRGSYANIGDYVALTKPRVMSLVVFTALVGLMVAPGGIDPFTGVVALLCIAAGAGAAGALNMWYDADIDAVMARTAMRPIPSGRVSRSEALCDVANLILGAILFVSPWMFGFDAGTVSTNAYITGIAIAILAIAALAAFAVWEEWLNLVVGLWALVSPWVLGFQGTTAMTVHVVIGAAVAILAAIELWMLSQIPPRLTTGR